MIAHGGRGLLPRQSEKNVQVSLRSYIGISDLSMSISVLVLVDHFICHVVMEKAGCSSITVIAVVASPTAMTSMLSLIEQVVVHRAHVITTSSSSSSCEQHLLDWTDCRHLVVILDRELRWYRR